MSQCHEAYTVCLECENDLKQETKQTDEWLGVILQWGLSVCSMVLTHFNWNLCDVVSLRSEGVRFLAFFCLTASSTGNFFPQSLHGKANGCDCACLLSFFFPLSCPSPQEGCTGDLTIHHCMFKQSGLMLRTCINHSPRWWTGGSSCH